jgi:hypothetical protein
MRGWLAPVAMAIALWVLIFLAIAAVIQVVS